jgi:hypothetical protein
MEERGGAGCASSLTADKQSANSTCNSNSGSGRCANLDVTFLHRLHLPDKTASGDGGGSSSKQQEVAGLPTVVKGRGSVPLRASPARLQVSSSLHTNTADRWIL